MSLVASLVVLCHVLSISAQSYQLHNADSSILSGASDACLQACNANVTCTEIIGQLYANPFYTFEDKTDLVNLCTSSCLQSLTGHRELVSSACSGVQYYDQYENTYSLPTEPDDFILYAYQIACLKRSDDQFCNTYLQEHNSPSAACDQCVLGIAQAQINSPFAVDDGVRANYAVLTSECHATGYPTTSASSVLISTQTPTKTTCDGSSYIIQPTDDFYSIPRVQSVSTDQLLNTNALPYNVQEFPKTGSLCITNKCTIHVLVANETCDSVASAAGISTLQLQTWNLNINDLCTNLNDFVGDTLCVSNPLGTYSLPDSPSATATPAPSPVPAPPNTAPNVTESCGLYYVVHTGDDCSTITLKFSISLTDFRFLNPGLFDNCTNLWLNYAYCVQSVGDISLYPGYGIGPTKTIPPFVAGPGTSIPWTDPDPTPDPNQIIIPLANGTRVDCWQYTWVNDTNPAASDCWGIAFGSNIDREQFALWNPSLDKNLEGAEHTSYDYPCTVSMSVSYCVAVASPTPVVSPPFVPPTPRAAGEIENCGYWFPVHGITDCGIMLANIDLSMETFYKMNPSVKEDCSGLSDGTYYCGSTDKIGLIDPDESHDAKPSPTSLPPPTTTSPNGIVTPTPIQSGMTTNCQIFYQVHPGDTCDFITRSKSISLNDFYTWNPFVKPDCSQLWPDYYVCVGVLGTTPPPARPAPPGPTQSGVPTNCNRWVMQKNGVFCADMAQNAGITLDRLYELNPALERDCSGLWVGYAYCVGTG